MSPARAPLPRKVWIGPYEFPLRAAPADDPALHDEEGAADGVTLTDEAHRGIVVCSELPPRKFLEVVWHELTHAVNWVAEIEDGEVVEEDLARAHGEIWSQLWLDNPRLQRWHSAVLNAIRRERASA